MKNLITLVFLFGCGSAQAATIDFEDVTSGECAGPRSSVTSRGFEFSGNPIDPNLFVCDAGVNGGNTSAALINANQLSILTMSAVDSSAFSLSSFYAGSRTNDYDQSSAAPDFGASTGIQVVGTLVGGGTITESISFNGLDWDQFSLSAEFTNLSSVKFTSLGGGRTEFLIDDITVTAVPIPAAVWLFGSGLGLLGWLRRRQTA